ncbi:MAG: GGDEF domain-containing protein [Chitinivibrionales bacterium]
MSCKRSRWGIWLFVFSILLISALTVLELKYPLGRYGFFYLRLTSWLGIGFSILSTLSGHFSYPRVHNLKVYLAGYLTGLSGLFFFTAAEGKEPPVLTALYLSIFFNYLLILFLPSYVKYRTTKYLTFAIVGVQAVLLGFIAWQPQTISWFLGLQRDTAHSIIPWISLIWAALVTGVSRIHLKDEFYLGGIIAGTALFYAFGWASPLIFFDYHPFERMMFVSATLFLLVGIMIHWFSRMEHRVSYDPLLHIYNRTFCSKIIAEQSNISTIPPLSLAMVDIDHFKKVNDTHGHQAGDSVLYHVAQTISREVVPQGIVCRYGGEEIAVFFPRRQLGDVQKIMEKVRVAVEQMSVHCGKKRLHVTVSCGISQREERGQSIEKVIEYADKALYKAKKGGRNQVKAARVSSVSSAKS